jgi:hypothetical protein
VVSPQLRVLHAAIRSVVRPALTPLGFVCDRSPRTFRKPVGECMQVINFQAGQRFMEGRFTINLGVYHPRFRQGLESDPAPSSAQEYDCILRERLGTLRDTLISRFSRRFISTSDTFIKWWLVTPGDKWWCFSDAEDITVREVRSALQLLVSRGIPWLDSHSDDAQLRAAADSRWR